MIDIEPYGDLFDDEPVPHVVQGMMEIPSEWWQELLVQFQTNGDSYHPLISRIFQVGRYVQKDERSGWQANPTVQDLQNYVYNRQSLPVVHPAAVASDGFYRNWDLLRDPSKRVRNNGKFPVIAWLQSNCKAKARRKALENLSRNVPVPVHFGGRCEVGTGFNPQNQRMSENVDLSEPNTKIFNNFKYCLVMESKNRQGYITEKLINAYYSGCLPIYQGSRDPNRPDREFDIFRIFNPHSMVYYDTSNPGEAVKLMRELEANETEYERRLSAPILHNSTSEQYFSLSPKIGGGYINRRVREMMGIPPLELFDV